MQTITRDVLVEKAISLLSAGTVDRVLGWKAGDLKMQKHSRQISYLMISAAQTSQNIW